MKPFFCQGVFTTFLLSFCLIPHGMAQPLQEIMPRAANLEGITSSDPCSLPEDLLLPAEWLTNCSEAQAQIPLVESDSSPFKLTFSGDIRIEPGSLFSGEGLAYADAEGNFITLPRDYDTIPSANNSVGRGAASISAAGGTPLGNNLSSFSTAVGGAAAALSQGAAFPGPGFTDVNELARTLAVNLGLGDAGEDIILQGFINVGVDPDAGNTASNRQNLARFHEIFAGLLISAEDAKLVFVNPKESDQDFTLDAIAELSFDMTFTGEDQLTVKALAFSSQSYADRAGVPEAELETWDDRQTDDFVEFYELFYRFPINNAQFFVGLKDLYADDLVPTTTNMQGDTVGAFFSKNPLSYDYHGGSGFGFNVQTLDSLNVAAAFLTDDDFIYDPDGNETMFNDGYTAFTQLTYMPSDRFAAALTYNFAYNPNRVGLEATVLPGFFLARKKSVVQNGLGINLGYDVASNVNVSGWFGYEWTDVQDFEADYNRLTWGLNLGFPNLFGGQHEFGLSVGVPPYVTRESGNFLERQDEPFLAQVYYRYDVTDYLAIQPGIMYLDNPAGNKTLEDIWLGTLRFQVTF